MSEPGGPARHGAPPSPARGGAGGGAGGGISRHARAALITGAALILTAAPASAGDAAAGREKARQCQTCHGIDGIARIPEAPHIAAESELYLRTQLEAFRSGRRQHPIMSVVAQGLDDADIADLAAWYASIRISVDVPE